MKAQPHQDENHNALNTIRRQPLVQPLLKRPQTTKVPKPLGKALVIASGEKKKPKKTDPVARFKNLQTQWKSSSFLKSSDNNKQGRKLELDRFHKWSSIVHAHNSNMAPTM